MPKVDTIVTKFTQEELATALCRAHLAYFGETPADPCLACAWAHNVLECGRDAHGVISSCRCFNLGNITIAAKDYESVPYWQIVCSEQQRNGDGSLNGKWVSTVMRFAAFDSLLDGAIFYWALLARRPRSLAAMRTGDGYKFGLALGADHYMTANPEPYARSLASLAREGAALVQGLAIQDTSGDADRAGQLMNMIALTLDESVRDFLNPPKDEGESNT
ncbi:MAG: hypothetical protein WC683_02115 [bacterium]